MAPKFCWLDIWKQYFQNMGHLSLKTTPKALWNVQSLTSTFVPPNLKTFIFHSPSSPTQHPTPPNCSTRPKMKGKIFFYETPKKSLTIIEIKIYLDGPNFFLISNWTILAQFATALAGGIHAWWWWWQTGRYEIMKNKIAVKFCGEWFFPFLCCARACFSQAKVGRLFFVFVQLDFFSA